MASYGFEFYSTGTISVTTGMTAFTGTGTAWQVRGCEGALLVITGANAVSFVASLSSDNAGELRMPWAGATMVDAQYTMWLPSAAAATNLANHQRLAEIIASIQNAQPASDVLENIALLPVGKDKLLIGDASGQYVLIDRSELGINDQYNNLSQLAAIAKANNQFVIMGANGTITLMAIKELTDAIAEKYKLPAGGTADQLLDATGAAISKAGLPISAAVLAALNAKLNLSGGIITGNVIIQDVSLISRVRNNIEDGLIWNIENANWAHTWSMFLNRFSGNESLAFAAYTAGTWQSNPLTMHRNGNVQIAGSISAGSKNFVIDHPLDPLNKNLVHASIETAANEVRYRGLARLVDGRATISIDDAYRFAAGTFEALVQNASVTSLQNQEGYARVRPSAIEAGSFEIICEDSNCTDTVSWEVIADRKDAYVLNVDPHCERGSGRFIPEYDKED